MTDRVAAVVLLVLAGAYAAQALTFDVAFMADPLGPKAAPLLFAAGLAFTAIWLFARPAEDPAWPTRDRRSKIAVVLATFVLYAIALETLGFVLATTLEILTLALLLGARLFPALIAGAAFSTAAYYTFVFALGVPLPIGQLFSFLGS